MFDFAENAIVDSLDKVPKDFQGLYVETEDGKFKLNGTDAAVGSAVVAIQGLNKALKASRAEANDAKGKAVDISNLSEYGSDPSAILEGVTKALEAASKAAKGKGNEDTAAQVKAAQEALGLVHGKELEKHSTRNGALQKQLYGLMVNNEAVVALAAANAVNPALVLPFIEQQVKVMEDDGKFVVKVKGEDGAERFSGTTGTHMTIKELVDEMKADEKYQPLFKSEAPQGGGRTPTHVPGRKPTGDQRSSLDKIAAGLPK